MRVSGGPDSPPHPPPPPPKKNHKAIVFLSNTGLYPPKNHKALRTAFNVRPSLAVVLGFPIINHQLKKQKIEIKNVVRVGPPLTKLYGLALVIVRMARKFPNHNWASTRENMFRGFRTTKAQTSLRIRAD